MSVVIRGSLSLAFVASLGLAGCGGGATCESAADNVVKITKNDLEKMLKSLPAEAQEAAKKEAGGDKMRDEFVKSCKEKKPAKDELACAAKAKNLEDLAKCERKK